jgi:hypothetical protein
MRRTTFAIAVFLLASLSSAFSQRINGRFVTSMYAWQRYDTIGVQKSYVLGYQTAQFDIFQKDISIHTYFQGFNEFGSFTSSGQQVRLYNLYLKASNIADVLDISLGRQPVYAGVGFGTIDGALSRLHFVSGRVVLVGYAGAVPPPYQKAAVIEHVDKNFMVGGQIITSLLDGGRIAISCMNSKAEEPSYFAIRRDSLDNALGTLVTPDAYSNEFVGVDATYRASAAVSAYGRYEYDMNYKHVSRAQLFSRVSVTDQIALTGEYIYRSPRIPFNSYFSIFPRNSVEEVEGGVEYSLSPLWKVFGRVARVSYTFDDNRRYSAGVSNEYGTVSYSGSVGFDGKLNSFSAQCYYPLFERTFVPTLGAEYAEYRLSWDSPVEHVFAGVAGATVRPVPAFSFDLQFQALNNRIVQHDVRFFARVNYWFSQQLNLFQ